MLQSEPVSQKAASMVHVLTLIQTFSEISPEYAKTYFLCLFISVSCLSLSLSLWHIHTHTHTHTHGCLHSNFFHCRQDKYLSVNTACFMLKVFHPLKICKCNRLVQSILINCRFRADNREVQQERRIEPCVSVPFCEV